MTKKSKTRKPTPEKTTAFALLAPGKRKAYVAVMTDEGDQLGIAVEGEEGYHPISIESDLGGTYKNREHAEKVAEECNRRLGITPTDAFKIVASTMFQRTDFESLETARREKLGCDCGVSVHEPHEPDCTALKPKRKARGK